MTENNCVFCDRSKFEERLVGETQAFWIIATLGQITDGGYLLLVPKRHVKCIGDMEPNEISLLGDLSVKTFEALLHEYGIGPGLVFEHGVVGQTIKHAHLHIVPWICVLTDRIKKDFPSSNFSSVNSTDTLDELRNLYVARQEPYLFWSDLCGPKICWNPPAPPQYLRIVVAEALGRQERANWRNMNPELDKKLWQETVRRLKPYFP